jgi:hypothetical protein
MKDVLLNAVPGVGSIAKGASEVGKAWTQGFYNYFTGEGKAKVGEALERGVGNQTMGHSPPPEGPLSTIKEGSANIARSWIDSFSTALREGDSNVGEYVRGFYNRLLGDDPETGENLQERLARLRGNIVENTTMWGEAMATFASSAQSQVGSLVSSVLGGTKTMGAAWKDLAKQMAISFIKSLLMQQIQHLVSAKLGVAAEKTAGKAKASVNADVAGSAATAFAASHMPAPAAKAVGAAMKASVIGTYGTMSGINFSMGSFMGGQEGGGGVLGGGLFGGGGKEGGGGPLPGLGGGPMPKMAAGGVVTGPTPVLAGEAGPELIAPLDRLGEIMSSMNMASSGAGGGGNYYLSVTVSGGAVDEAAAENIASALSSFVEDRGGNLVSSRAIVADEAEAPIVT